MSQKNQYFLAVCVLAILILFSGVRGGAMIYSHLVGYEHFQGKVVSAKCLEPMGRIASYRVYIEVKTDGERKEFNYPISDCRKFSKEKTQGRFAFVTFDYLGEVVSLSYDGIAEISKLWLIRGRIISFAVLLPLFTAFMYFAFKKYRSLSA